MHVVVVGAGGLGSLIGGLLAREHEVTLVGREAHVEAIRQSGLLVHGAFDLRIAPRATTDLEGVEADLALVTVKSYDTGTVARELATADVDAICSLQNGVGNEATLAAHADVPVLAGTATFGAELTGPGRVICTGLGVLVLGARDGGPSDLAEEFASRFRMAGVDATAATDMPRRLWSKLAVNAGVNPVTALARVENGALRDGPAGDLARTAAREAATVAGEHGVDLDPAEPVAALEDVVETTATNRSSMLQDVANGSQTEIEAINGAVVERADAAGVDAPVNRTLAQLVRAWEAEQGLR